MAEKPPIASPATEKPEDKPAKPLPPESEENKANPTRYGDWEKNGRCIDF